MKRPLLTLAIWLVGGCAAILAGLYALGAAIETGAAQPPPPAPAATSRAALEASPEQPLPTLDPWPFKSDTAVLRCQLHRDSGQPVATVRVGNTFYALDGMARSEFPKLDPVWRPDPDIPGTGINIGPAIRMALSLCETRQWVLEVQKSVPTSRL